MVGIDAIRLLLPFLVVVVDDDNDDDDDDNDNDDVDDVDDNVKGKPLMFNGIHA